MPGAEHCRVYILRCADDSFYVGVTTDLDARVELHNAGRGPMYTASRLPVQLVWSEPHQTMTSARQREQQLKRWSRAKKKALIDGNRSHLHRLARSRQRAG